MLISLIAAVAKNGVIGVKGDLPWRLPDDLKFFSKTTKGHHVVTGRKNYESIPPKFRPLPGRVNIVVTRQQDFEAPGAVVVRSLPEAIEFAREKGETELFIIGGGDVYKQCMDIADRLYITHVDAAPEGDTFFPAIAPEQWNISEIMRHPADDVHNFAFKTCLYTKKTRF